jgi:hypothetical protein
MNALDVLRSRNNTTRLIRVSNRHKNVLKWSSGESWSHVVMKLRICNALKLLGREFYTEAIFDASGLRADVVDCDAACVYEVVNSESEESVVKKMKDYPLPVVVVRADSDITNLKL